MTRVLKFNGSIIFTVVVSNFYQEKKWFDIVCKMKV